MSSCLGTLRSRLPLAHVSLVVGRQERVGLAVTLDLRHLVERLPLGAGFGVGAIHRPAGERLDDREHDPVAQVAVVGDGEHPPGGLLLVRLHPLPEIARVVAAQGLEGGVGLHEARLETAVPKDHHPVQVVAGGVRRPLVADEGGELIGLVVLLGGVDRQLPGRAVGGFSGQRRQRFGELALGEGDDDLDRRGHALLASLLHHVVPPPARGIVEHLPVPRVEAGEEAHVVRVIGHHEEVERPRQLDLQTRRGRKLLAACKAVGVLRQQPSAERPGVHGHPRVQVGVAPVHMGRKVASGVRRVVLLPRKDALQRLAVRHGGLR
jgi:hypothetical protein